MFLNGSRNRILLGESKGVVLCKYLLNINNNVFSTRPSNLETVIFNLFHFYINFTPMIFFCSCWEWLDPKEAFEEDGNTEASLTDKPFNTKTDRGNDPFSFCKCSQPFWLQMCFSLKRDLVQHVSNTSTFHGLLRILCRKVPSATACQILISYRPVGGGA